MPNPYFARGIPLLPVANVRRSIEFYVDVLEFKMGFNAGEYGGVRRDAIEIHFWRTDDPNLAKHSSCRIEVTHIHDLYSHCREKGVVDPEGDIAAQTWIRRSDQVAQARAAYGRTKKLAAPEELGIPRWVQPVTP